MRIGRRWYPTIFVLALMAVVGTYQVINPGPNNEAMTAWCARNLVAVQFTAREARVDMVTACDILYHK